MPDWGRHLRPRLAGLQLAPGRQAEIVEELSQHLDERYEELRAGGADEAQAQRLGVEPLDPITFGLVAVVVAVTAATSTIAPAWHATRIDPSVALRGE